MREEIIIWIALTQFTSGVLSQKHGLDLLKFQQNDYKVIPERVEIVTYNKRVIRHATAVTFKYNRTTTAVNGSVIANVELGDDVEVVVQGYKFLSNEYRQFPMRFQVNACDALSKNVGGVARYKNCGNFTGCPVPKNKVFSVCNWTVDESKLPPFIPTGKYMLEVQWLLNQEEILLGRVYAAVDRPVTIKYNWKLDYGQLNKTKSWPLVRLKERNK